MSDGCAVGLSGRRLAGVSRSESFGPLLHRRDLDRLESAKIAGTDGGWWRFHSPDSQWIGFWSGNEGELRKVPRAGRHADDPGASQGSLGRHLDRSLGGGLRTLYQRGSCGVCRPTAARRRSNSRAARAGREPPLAGERSPAAGPSSSACGAVRGWRTTTSACSISTPASGRCWCASGLAPKYAASGHLLFGREGALFAVAFDLRALRTSGAPVPVVEGVAMESVTGAAAYDLSQRGHLFYLPARWRSAYKNRLVTVDRDGNRSPTGCPEGAIRDVRRVARTARSRCWGAMISRRPELWTCSLASGTQQQLTRRALGVLSPVWTRQRRLLRFHSQLGSRTPGSFLHVAAPPRRRCACRRPISWPCAAAAGGVNCCTTGARSRDRVGPLARRSRRRGEPTAAPRDSGPARRPALWIRTRPGSPSRAMPPKGRPRSTSPPIQGWRSGSTSRRVPGARAALVTRRKRALLPARRSALGGESSRDSARDWPLAAPPLHARLQRGRRGTPTTPCPTAASSPSSGCDWDDTVDVVVVENWFEELKRLVPVD